jgi:putative endopeptidase
MKTRLWMTAAAGALAISGSALAQAQTQSQPQSPKVDEAQALANGSIATPHYGAWGFDLAGMDKAIKPGNNFFDYADGAAVAAIKIPSDLSGWGGFSILSELSENRVKVIVEEAAATAPLAPTTSDAKVGAFFKAFMDQARVEQLGVSPLKPDLDAVRAVTSRDQLAALMGHASEGFVSSVFDVGIEPDEKNPDVYSVHLSQAGLGLPDRDYYLTAQFAAQKAKYQLYVAKLLGLAGWTDPDAAAKAVVDMETQIATASWARDEERDPDKTYNPTTVAALAQAAPGFAWRPFLDAAGLSDVDHIVVAQNTAFPKLAAIYAATPLDTLKAWEAFHIVDSASPFLPDAFVQARFDFRNHTLSGQPEIAQRWKRGVSVVGNGMGEAIGKVYVERYFPPESKAKMLELTAELKAAFRTRIEKLTWMSPATKVEALKKLANYTIRIGYPDTWRDYSALTIRADDLYGDEERSQAFEWARQIKRLHKPVDKAEWEMTPQTVNAYNEPLFNEVVFPAAILQPPFFDPNADPAINYGGIGGVIGHEMTHGFDDEGRKFDANGHLRDWWTPEDAKRFEALAKRLGAQYSSYSPVPGGHVNGQLTMGENIADLGGLNLALEAYHASLHGKPAPVINGLTGDERVFLGWAQVWTNKTREASARQRLVADPHSPPIFRVNGVVRNIDAWYKAFHVVPGQALYLTPEERVHIW